MENLLIFAFTNLITNYILIDFYRKRYTVDKSRISQILLYLFFVGIATCVNLAEIPLLNAALYLLITLFLSLLYYKVQVKDLFINFIFIGIIYLLEAVVFYAIILFTSLLPEYKDSIYIQQSDTVISMFVILLVYHAQSDFFVVMAFDELDIKEKSLLIIFPTVSLCIGFLDITIVRYIAEPFVQQIVLITLMIIIVLNVYMHETIKSFQKYNDLKIEYELTKQENNFKYNHYRQVEQSNDNLNAIIHDFKRYVNAINVMLSNEENKQVLEFIATINNKLDGKKDIVYSRNHLLSAILNEKECIMKKHGIIFDFDTIESDLAWVADFDIVTIFSNLLDNAIEANEQITNDAKISFCIRQANQNIVIKLSNTCFNTVLYNDGTKSTKSGHKGYGLKNIQRSIDKYNGIMDIEISDHNCETILVLPLP